MGTIPKSITATSICTGLERTPKLVMKFTSSDSSIRPLKANYVLRRAKRLPAGFHPKHRLHPLMNPSFQAERINQWVCLMKWSVGVNSCSTVHSLFQDWRHFISSLMLSILVWCLLICYLFSGCYIGAICAIRVLKCLEKQTSKFLWRNYWRNQLWVKIPSSQKAFRISF